MGVALGVEARKLHLPLSLVLAGLWLARNALECRTAPLILLSLVDVEEGVRGQVLSLLLALEGEGHRDVPDPIELAAVLDVREFLAGLA